MATQSPLEEGRPLPETVVQQSILQQAQAAAAAAAQTDPARPTRQEALLQKTDLLTSDEAEDDIPPPTYGEIYGEIRDEKNGLGTSARVTDDGRVNIRINQFNRRLSQIFTPALRQQVQSVQDSRPPPLPYIPPSLGGEEGVPPPPPLNIVIQVVGSRGDVQPFVALGKVLKDTYGHRVRLATHPNFKDFVQENGLEFFSIGGDPSRLMAFMVKNPSLMPGFRSLLSGDVGQRRRDVAEYIQGCWRSCYEAGNGMGLRATDDDISELSENDPSSEPAARPFVADCIIANPPSFAHIHCAEKLGIPLHIMFTMPYSPTQAFPHPLANIQSSNADPQLTNYISYAMIEVLSWQGLGDIINRFRKKCLGLDPVSLIWAPGMLQRLKVPHTYCWSPALIPKPKDWGPHISISGFYFLNSASNYTPAPDFQAFLDAGPPPVYIGFGSIVLDDPNTMTELIFEAVRKTGQRVLLSKGWGGMGTDRLRIPDGVFILGNVPHDWLFKHVSCVVHHGGAGTTAAGIAAGRPTVVVPFFGDQPFWGAMVARAGAGPDPIPHKQLTADKLADAINYCLKPESLERAKELASKIAAERGSDIGAQSFHQYLEADRLRCTLAPSRPAAWRIKRTQVRVSAFAACTLANANLLDFHDLKLFRPREYYTDEGPWDPISGGAAACWRAFSGMAMGVAEFPSETLKPLHIPVGSSRQQSQESVPTIARKCETSHVGERPTPPTSPEQSQTSLNVQESLTRVRSPPNLSGLSSPTLNIGSNSMSDALQGQLSPKQDDASRSRVRSRNESGFGKDHDMLRQTGVHTSKGLGRIVKAAVQAPMEASVSVTKGFHNLPKLWGDDTVRPQEQVSDFKSGAMAAGKEFGFGWYDGVTGLFTQPWKGAQKEGTSGFVKGIGKGIGGFATKPFAALSGVLGHTMKGVHKEVQKLFGSNVQNYIVASRVAQGHEEWLQSSDVEKQDVIVRWKLIQKYIKKKHNPDEMVQDVLEAQRKKNIEDTKARQNCGHTASSAQSASADAPTLDPESAMLAMGCSQSPEELLKAAEINETIRLSVQKTSRGDAEEDANMEQAIQENVSQLQRQRQEAADHQADQENLRQAIAASETEAQRHASEALEYKKQLKRAMAQTVTGGSPGVQQPSSYDRGHLTGTTQSEFEAQQQGQRGEKTTQERTEEEIVMEYVKKQSLLEVHHQNKGKGRATAIEDKDDEDLQKALKLSMQGHARPSGPGRLTRSRMASTSRPTLESPYSEA
ncbi:glycosyltransferase family 1 protein [Lepidopterella palustris CBS 459.81]|uniref:Glycosyltransferase family 1 protein n=1 Tax=Lepidopterella palustris CBS 459.81 TaxID=1314670 RepID=A0A8E2JAT1_9PEZI|nr:glycosyltransferase family 1 protein [Lepidopterella palustris CBS 459.81]